MLPPLSTIAFMVSTMLSGRMRSVSRVPGEPPRCVTPPATPWPVGLAASTTVVPESAPV